jgi:hypothetical protein
MPDQTSSPVPSPGATPQGIAPATAPATDRQRIPTEVVHRLPRDPVHLWQLNHDPGTYNNAMGCGAFSTAMALSCYDPARFGTYDAARRIFDQMDKVPFFGGTFESQNAAVAHQFNYYGAPYSRGTVEDLMGAIDHGAPAVLLIEPKTILSIAGHDLLKIGQHDVLLVGYSLNAHTQPLNIFINNPWLPGASQTAPPGLSYPGNQTIPVARLDQVWTGNFTPFFPSAEAWAAWRRAAHRG